LESEFSSLDHEIEKKNSEIQQFKEKLQKSSE